MMNQWQTSQAQCSPLLPSPYTRRNGYIGTALADTSVRPASLSPRRIYTTNNFEAAVVKAVNLGGDADTIGAITGGLAGAMYGVSAIPDRWLIALDESVMVEIDNLCDAAIQQRTAS